MQDDVPAGSAKNIRDEGGQTEAGALLKFLNPVFLGCNIAMKLLPYQEETFSKYQAESVQEFRFALSEQIRQQVFYATFVNKIETRI